MRFLIARAISTCEPATIAAVAAVASAAMAGTSMVMSADSQRKAANYNEPMGKIRERDALERGAIEGAAAKDQARRVASAQAEGISMAGGNVGSGTALDLLVETAGIGEFQKLKIQNDAHREAWGIKSATELDVFQQRAQARGGYLNAAGTFLGGASSAYSSYKTK